MHPTRMLETPKPKASVEFLWARLQSPTELASRVLRENSRAGIATRKQKQKEGGEDRGFSEGKLDRIFGSLPACSHLASKSSP